MKPISEVITTIGQTRGRQPVRSFGQRQADRLFHTYVVGQTGSGKSTLLAYMMKQDIAASQGFCLIDPHGDLAQSVAKHAGSDALYWDAADPASPYGYNPLTPVSGQHRSLVASGLIETLKKQWSDAWGARMEHLLRYVLLALLEHRGSTLRDIIPMFLDSEFRKSVIATVTDQQVRYFWTVEYKAMNLKTAVDGVAPIANKLGAFLAHPVVRKAMCEPVEPLRFRKLMDERKTLIVNLSKGRLGTDTANVLGGMIVSSLALAAYSRQTEPEHTRKPYLFYVDEFHSFTTKAFAGMLPELRKYRLGLVLTHQHTSQIDMKVLDAILGNAGTLIAFRLGASDAAIFSRQLGGDIPTAGDLIGLPNYQMYVKMMIDGAQSRAFSAICSALPIEPDPSDRC